MTYFDNLPYEPEFDHLMRDYRQRHKYCPACGGCNVSTTLVTYMTNEKGEVCDDNRARCVCGWVGKAYEPNLIPKE